MYFIYLNVSLCISMFNVHTTCRLYDDLRNAENLAGLLWEPFVRLGLGHTSGRSATLWVVCVKCARVSYLPASGEPASPEPNACVCLPIESHEQPQHPHDYRAQEHHYTIASTTAAPAEATARTARTAEATAAGDSSNRRQHQQETAATEQQQQQQGNNNRSAQATTSTIGTMGVHNPGPQGCGKQAEEHVNCNHRRWSIWQVIFGISWFHNFNDVTILWFSLETYGDIPKWTYVTQL